MFKKKETKCAGTKKRRGLTGLVMGLLLVGALAISFAAYAVECRCDYDCASSPGGLYCFYRDCGVLPAIGDCHQLPTYYCCGGCGLLYQCSICTNRPGYVAVCDDDPLFGDCEIQQV